MKAELELQARTEEENAEAAAREAKAVSEQELQAIRAQLEALRLKADVQIPAEMQKRAAELQAVGAAANIEETGKALAKVLAMNIDIWKEAGQDARDIYLIQHLEEILSTVVAGVNNIKVQEVALVDNGDGQSLPSYVASFPATVNKILEEMKVSTGIDIIGILKGQKD
jgi:flotillin